MRNVLSALVIAASFALLVPDNGAQAVAAAEVFGAGTVGAPQASPAGGTLHERDDAPQSPVESDAALLLALGFVGAVMARRLRAE